MSGANSSSEAISPVSASRSSSPIPSPITESLLPNTVADNDTDHADVRIPVAQDESSEKPRLHKKVVKASWFGELLAWLLAALSITIVAIMLMAFKDKKLSGWHSHITINTMINFLSQFAQTALLIPLASSISQLKWIHYQQTRPLSNFDDFDKASRQPIDNFILLWKHPHWLVLNPLIRDLAHIV